MPTYEYACKDCGEHRDVVQSFHDDPLTECPSCGGNLRKVFSAAGIIFKGSGWHIKDYATSGSTAGEGTNGSSGNGERTKGDSSSSGDGGSSSSSEATSGSSEKPSSSSTTSTSSGGAPSTSATTA